MNILFVIENYLPHIGGVEVVFKNLAEGLVKRGHTATIITHRLKGTATEETINGVKVKRISCLGSRYLFTFLSIPAAISAARKADLVHTTTFNGFFPAWLAAKLSGKPLVATIHEVWIGKWREYADFGWLSATLHDLVERLIYLLPAVDKYVAVSNSTRKQLLQIGKKENRIITVYNGVDYNYFNPKKYDGSKIRKKYALQKSYVMLVYGRPGPSKGIEYAITAMKEIGQKLPAAKMLLMLSRDKQYAGKYKQLLQLISKLGLNGKIIDVEPVPHSELPNYIKAADCVIVPSISEGFGYVAAEAAAMGKPIVASNTTSLPEVVSGKHILVQPKSSREIADAVTSIHSGKYHKTPLKRFTIEENVRSYLSLYGTLVKGASKRTLLSIGRKV
ncbi:glycosyltransferase family 4 protein [Candidatus Woesearchaeota archaeon]|nr:glycosyltransferase family 4 protein [Candidatus Woesearchaeota archaeon]